MKKWCYKCDKTYIGAEDFFHKDKTRRDGLSSSCKACKKVHDNKVWKNRDYRKGFDRKSVYLDKKYKNKLRSEARLKYDGMYDKCSVLGCNKDAELHHVNYKPENNVVPLCRSHHADMHRKENVVDDIIAGRLKGSDFEPVLKKEITELKQLLEEACFLLFHPISFTGEELERLEAFQDNPKIKQLMEEK